MASKNKIKNLVAPCSFLFIDCSFFIKKKHMLRSVLTARLPTIVPSRALSTIKPPKTPVDLAHLSDNAGAVSQVNE